MEREKANDANKSELQEEELEEGLEESMDGSDAPAETQPGSGTRGQDDSK